MFLISAPSHSFDTDLARLVRSTRIGPFEAMALTLQITRHYENDNWTIDLGLHC